MSRIDILHIDTEGYDHKVISQVDFNATWAPQFVLFERNHMTISQYLSVRNTLRRSGYHIVGIWPDGFAWKRAP